jgi:SAM-dependent methyltransferase
LEDREMEDADRQEYIARYEGRLKRFGHSPESLGWGRHGRQEVRFSVLAEYALCNRTASVLDVGCGFADLYDFLKAGGWGGMYTGLDIVPGLLKEAHRRHPLLDLHEADITKIGDALPQYDVVVASGVFNAALRTGDNRIHISESLNAMWDRTRHHVAVDFLSTIVDFQQEGAWHTDPSWALQLAQRFSRRVLLRHDYMPYEFALFVFRDDSISPRNVFQEYEQRMKTD